MRDVRKVALRVVAMLPETVGDGRTRSGRRRHDREPLPVVRTDLHIGVIAARFIAIVPDGQGRDWLAAASLAGDGLPGEAGGIEPG